MGWLRDLSAFINSFGHGQFLPDGKENPLWCVLSKLGSLFSTLRVGMGVAASKETPRKVSEKTKTLKAWRHEGLGRSRHFSERRSVSPFYKFFSVLGQAESLGGGKK
jgi:hypothetical protein